MLCGIQLERFCIVLMRGICRECNIDIKGITDIFFQSERHQIPVKSFGTDGQVQNQNRFHAGCPVHDTCLENQGIT